MRLLSLFLVLALAGCGMVEKEKQDEEASAASLLGSWEGLAYDLTESENNVKEVVLRLEGDRSFLISGEGMRVAGEYTDFSDSKSLVFMIHESNSISFGLKGMQEHAYTLTDIELSLKSKNVMMRLKRGNRESSLSFDGGWLCVDSQDNRWNVSFQQSTFWAQVTKSGGSPGLMLRGSLQYQQPKDDKPEEMLAKLWVEFAQPASNVALIEAKKTAKDKLEFLELKLFDERGQPIQGGKAVQCQRE